MSVTSADHSDRPDNARPHCPSCGVPMWLVEVERRHGPYHTDRLHFECKVCETAAIIPPL